MADSETAYAKINLALHVRARRTDGYHDIETLFAFVDAGDRLSVEPADALTLEIGGPFATGLASEPDNLVLRAARLLRDRYAPNKGAVVYLDKRLPVASGLGGGSADAAAAARLLVRHWNLGLSNDELASLLAPLGADIPACVPSCTAIGTGIGADLSAIDMQGLSGMPVLLVNPGCGLETGPVFSGWDGEDRGSLEISGFDSLHAAHNDLEPPAIALRPEIADVLEALRALDPLLARMSGSGASCFALFADENALAGARRSFGNAHPHWWTMAGRLR